MASDGPAWLTYSDMAARVKAKPAPRRILGPLKEGTWGILAGPPGTGKSMLALSWMQAFAASASWCHWEAPDRMGGESMLVDAEMSENALAGRCSALADPGGWMGCWFNHQEVMQEKGLPNFSLGREFDHGWLMDSSQDKQLVIVDNISFTLDPIEGGNLYSPETWNQVIPLLNWARTNRKCLLFIDHTNKEGHVAGSLQKQRGADFVFLLEKQEPTELEELACILKIEKYRDELPKMYRQAQRLSLVKGPIRSTWNNEPMLAMKDQVKEMVRMGADSKHISKTLDISMRQVQRYRR